MNSVQINVSKNPTICGKALINIFQREVRSPNYYQNTCLLLKVLEKGKINDSCVLQCIGYFSREKWRNCDESQNFYIHLQNILTLSEENTCMS